MKKVIDYDRRIQKVTSEHEAFHKHLNKYDAISE